MGITNPIDLSPNASYKVSTPQPEATMTQSCSKARDK